MNTALVPTGEDRVIGIGYGGALYLIGVLALCLCLAAVGVWLSRRAIDAADRRADVRDAAGSNPPEWMPRDAPPGGPGPGGTTMFPATNPPRTGLFGRLVARARLVVAPLPALPPVTVHHRPPADGRAATVPSGAELSKTWLADLHQAVPAPRFDTPEVILRRLAEPQGRHAAGDDRVNTGYRPQRGRTEEWDTQDVADATHRVVNNPPAAAPVDGDRVVGRAEARRPWFDELAELRRDLVAHGDDRTRQLPIVPPPGGVR